jgi:ABC-2 type transport system permease protein
MFSRFNAVEGFKYEAVLLCYAAVTMAFSLAEMFASGFSILPRLLGNGEFDRALVRPRGAIYQIIMSRMDLTRSGLLIQALIVLFYAVPKSGVAWTWDKILTFILMAACGCMAYSCLFLLFAAFAFFTVEGLEFMNLFTYGGKEFGRYPYSIYGKDVLRFLTYVVPLALSQYYPLLYLLGREQSALYMLSPLFGLLFVIPCHAVFRIGLSRFKSTGS